MTLLTSFLFIHFSPLQHGLLHIGTLWRTTFGPRNESYENAAVITSIWIFIDVLFLLENYYEESRLAIKGEFIEVSVHALGSCWKLKSHLFSLFHFSPLFVFRSGLRVLPNNAKMHYNYANFLRDTSNFNLAKYHYRTALQLWPNYPSAS